MKKVIGFILIICNTHYCIGQIKDSATQNKSNSSQGDTQELSGKIKVNEGLTKNAYKYILDYNVPSSPAFTILDVSPKQVTTGASAKPLVVNMFSNFLQTSKLEPGIALDFSPYILLGGGFKNLNEYHNDPFKQILANTLLSIATIKNPTNENNLDYSAGLRITLFDKHNLFSSNSGSINKIVNDIGIALENTAIAPVKLKDVPDDVIGSKTDATETVPVNLKMIYADAYSKIKEIKGYAASIGFGYRGTAKNSYLQSDSIINQQFKIWGSLTRYHIFKYADLLGIIQGKVGNKLDPEWKAGIALASLNPSNNIGVEVVYNTLTKKIEYGANFEIRLFQKIIYTISIGKRSIDENKTVVEKLRAISSFKFDIFGK